MATIPAPVLVYNRIDANRRNTFLLLPTFAVLLLPLAYGVTQVVVPFAFYRVYITAGRAQALSNLPSIEASTLKMVLLALVLATCVSVVVYFLSAILVLQLAHGHRLSRGEEPALWRTLENLCIGAGVRQPAVYVIESRAPNAFSTGRDPAHAALVVTRGLLRLLDERELSGVVAHELSHIGNRDTDLNNLLAALVATLRLPLDALRAFVASTAKANPLGFLAMACALILGVVILPTVGLWSQWMRSSQGISANDTGRFLVLPVHALFIGPLAGMFLRKIILHQREFLAHADAVLLTRDPEGLALALAKVGAATGTLGADVAMAHLYFVDPLPRTDGWLDDTFHSHPSVDARIALLARMGDGLGGQPLLEAVSAGTAYLAGASQATDAGPSRMFGPGEMCRLADARTMLYKSAEGSSAVLADLDSNVLVTVIDREAEFIRVRVGDGLTGYIPVSTRLMPADEDGDNDAGGGIHYRLESSSAFDATSVAGTQFRLTDHITPLYEKPDGWSDVALQLSSGTIVTFDELVANFARVEVDGTCGYIPCASGADRISPDRSHA
jgi:heat shock protein HtpX